MANGDIAQHPSPTNSSGNVSSFASPAFAGAPTVGNTDLIFAISSATVTTPSGYTVVVSDASFDGIYMFIRTVQSGDTGAAVTLSLGASRPVSIARYEVTGTATTNGSPTSKFYNSTSTTARSGNAITTSATTALFVFGTDGNSSLQTWSSWNLSLTQLDNMVPTGGTLPANGVVGYVNGATSGTLTPTATSSFSAVHYQVLFAAFTFSTATTYNIEVDVTESESVAVTAVSGKNVEVDITESESVTVSTGNVTTTVTVALVNTPAVTGGGVINFAVEVDATESESVSVAAPIARGVTVSVTETEAVVVATSAQAFGVEVDVTELEAVAVTATSFAHIPSKGGSNMGHKHRTGIRSAGIL